MSAAIAGYVPAADRAITWRLFMQVGQSVTKTLDFTSWDDAVTAALKVANRMNDAHKMQAGALDMITASLGGYTPTRTLAMGGWAAASYTPEWRIAIVPQGPESRGIDPEELREDVAVD